MSDIDEQTGYLDGDFDENAHQACYIFRPFTADDAEARPAKKRKVKHAAQVDKVEIPLLCNGDEAEEHSSQRLEKWQHFWAQKQCKIDEFVSENDATLLKKIRDFAASASTSAGDDRLCTGLVVSGPDSSVQNRLFSGWKDTPSRQKAEILIQLNANSCTSLQLSLKNIIKGVIVDVVGLEDYTAFLNNHKRLLPMNFDLELLELFVKEQGINKVIVSLVDVETFDPGVLSQLLSSLSSWSDRVPFVALLGIATTVELFESRLPKSTIELLDAHILNLASSEDLLYRVFATIQHDPENRIFLGPSSLAALHELSQSQGTTIEGFINIAKVAFMSHFFANALSALACEGNSTAFGEQILCTTVRNTDSFRDHCESLLEQGKPGRVEARKLLEDDSALLLAVRTAISRGQDAIRSALRLIDALRDLYRHLAYGEKSAFLLDLDFYNCMGDLTTSSNYRDIIAHMQKLTSSRLLDVVESLQPSTRSALDLQNMLKKVQTFQKSHKNDAVRIPEESANFNSFQPTKSPTKGNLSQAQKQYSALMDTLIDHVTCTVRSCSFDTETFMHEAFIINSRQLLLSLTTPRPRHVLERALAKPADYLGCECNARQLNVNGHGHERREDKHRLPPISILYNLLQEAGTIINVRDLFDAFESRIDADMPSISAEQSDDGENHDEDIPDDLNADTTRRRMAFCLFYRSLSELKMLGMVKSSTSAMTKKRALASEGGATVVGKGKKAYAEIDFIAKTSWAGL